jgi:hypothetical protein
MCCNRAAVGSGSEIGSSRRRRLNMVVTFQNLGAN